ncbi:MAG: sulfurtransferase-like selenium metabolism protein YedF [Chloroflexaceae bacterium]|nr:sulfurtransferase-like selenium metabolism protein YedF [Chloroflexaceae bacterium]
MTTRPDGTATLIVISRNGMGDAEPELGQRLIRTYLTLLLESNMLPGAICFYTNGVRLVTEGSPVLDLLEQLANRGVHLIVCKTCVDYFGLTDQVRVGVIGGMTDVIAAQWEAQKIIHL